MRKVHSYMTERMEEDNISIVYFVLLNTQQFKFTMIVAYRNQP